MLTKRHKYLKKQWLRGTLNVSKCARRMGYRGAAMTRGIKKVYRTLSQMGITVL